MVTAQAFWRDPEFAQFVPFIKATAAFDKRHGNHPRFDLKASTPGWLLRQAVAFTGPCAACGARIHPFRVRENQGAVYLAVACENTFRMGCSRGNKATRAYDAIWQLVKDEQRRDGEQGGLL